MDIDRAIRMAVETGKVEFGSQKAVKLALLGGAKALVLSSNCQSETRADLQRYAQLSQILLIEYAGTSIELGTVCGRPFPVSALSVLEAGDSNILEPAGGK